jgi:leucyl-tRNA synthetase
MQSKGNGVFPADVIKEFGADTARVFMLFKAPPDMALNWDSSAIQGTHRWLHRLHALVHDTAAAAAASPAGVAEGNAAEDIEAARNAAVTSVTKSLGEVRNFNVAVAELMKFSNVLKAQRSSGLLSSPGHYWGLVFQSNLMMKEERRKNGKEKWMDDPSPSRL